MPLWVWALAIGAVGTIYINVRSPETRLFLVRCIDNSVGNTLQGLAFSFVLFSIPTYLGLLLISYLSG
jgi:hypothetical protein